MSDLFENVSDAEKVTSAAYSGLRSVPDLKPAETPQNDYQGLRNKTSEQAGDIEWAKSIWDTIDNSPDPDKTRENIGMSLYLKQFFPYASIENIYQNTDIYRETAEKMGKPVKTTLEQSLDTWSDALRSNRLGNLNWKLMNTTLPEEKDALRAEINKLKSEMSSPAGNKTEGITSWTDPAIQFAGSWFYPALTMGGWQLGLNAATTLIAPEATAAKLAMKTVSWLISRGVTWNQTAKVEGGLLFDEMIDKNVPEEIAAKHARNHGLVAGAMEVIELEGAFTGMPWLAGSMKKAVTALFAEKMTALAGAKLLTTEAAKAGVKLGISTTFNSLQEVAQDASGLHFMRKAQTDKGEEYWKELSKYMDPADVETLYAAYMQELEKNEEYFGSQQYADDYFYQLLDTFVNSAKGSAVLFGAGGALGTTYNLARTGIQSATERKQRIKNEAQREARKVELEKEKEGLKGTFDKIYNKDREKAIDGELADIAEQEKQDTVSDAVEAEQESREQFVNNQTPESRENYDNARAQRDAIETEANKSPTQEAYDEKLNKQGFDETDVDDLMRYNDMLEAEENRQADSNGNWQLPPEEIERTAVQPEAVDEIQRVAQIVKEKTPAKMSDVEAEVAAGTFIDMLSQGLKLSHDETVQTVFMPEIARNVKAGSTVNINGHEVAVPKSKKGAVFFNPDDGKAIILLTEKADFSTWVHESTHILRRYVTGDALTALEKHYKVKNGKWTVKAEERFAENFTTYLMTGEAPTAELENVFQMIAKALMNVYYTLVGREMVSDDIKRVFDQMLTDPKSVFGQKQAGKETLYQILGKQGAERLDKAQGVTYRMDNYKTALDMDKAGKSAKSIRFATGWEKGAEGKWRYEEKDIRIKDTVWDKQLKERAEQYADQYLRYEELLKIPAFERTDEQTQELKSLSDFLRDERRNTAKIREHKEKELSRYKDIEVPITELVEAPEVFAAYPQLKKMKLRFLPEEEMEGNDGWYDKKNNEIAVNDVFLVLSQARLRSTLAHEIQHVIQDIEGFAPGGNTDVFTVENLDDLSSKIAKLPKKNPNRKRLNDILKVLKKSADDEFVDLTEYGIPDIVTPYEAYRRIAGEVEAWNVERRIDMSPAERMLTLLSETGDYSLDEQIILDESGQSARIDEEAERQYNEVVAKYKGTDQWLKAPNGQPTNLTERQWVQVRTPNFKAWFGDWENDPQNASKVVDENGEPRVVYHGTDQPFDVFRIGRGGYYSYALYFTDNKEEADKWGRNADYTKAVFLNIRNMNHIGSDNDMSNDLGKRQGEYRRDISPFIPFNERMLQINREFTEQTGIDGFDVNYKGWYLALQPNQIKSATDNVGTFDDTNPSILYQDEEDTYRNATEQGEFIPDDILNEYKGKDWADAEIEARADYRKEAMTYILNGSTAEQFLYDMSVNGEGKSEDYLQEIWNSTPKVKPEQIITSLTRRMLERIISTLKSISEKEKKEMGWPWNDLIKNYSKDHMISEDTYKSLMAQMKAEPQQYIEFLSECFENQQEFVDLLSSLYLHPDMEIERIKELERAIRGDQQTAKTTIAGLKEKIADLKTELREAILKGEKYQKLATRFAKLRELQKRRDEYNKLVRAIFRKIPQMCAIDVAEQIEAERGQYSAVKMKDTTRAKLQQEYLNTDNQKVKDKIQKRLDQKSLRDMSLEEVAEIAVRITQLCREGVDKQLDQLLEIREQRLEEADGLKTDVATSKAPHIVGSLSGKENKGSIYKRFVSYWADIHRMTDWMGPHWKAWLDKIKSAYVEEMKNVDRRMTALNNKMKELKLNAKILGKVEKMGNDTFTHNDLIGMYIALQNEDSRDALIFGNLRANPDTVDSVIDTLFDGLSYLTEAEKEFADWMVDSFSGEDRERLWSAYRKNENKSPPIIPRYFPMKRILDGSARVDEEPVIDIGQRSSRMVAVSKGFMKERLHNINWEHQAPIRIDALNIYTQAIQDQEHYIAFGQVSKDMKYVWAKVREDVTTKFGNSWAKSMGEWIDTVIDPRAYNKYYDNQNFFTNVLSNSIVASLTYNILTYLKQFPSVMFFLPYCSGSTLSLTTFKFMKDFKQMTEFAFKRSPWLKNRNIDDILTKTKKRLANPNSKFRTLTKFSEIGMEPISWIDEFACVIGWNAVYTHEMEHGATEEAAIKKADEALLRTQPQAFSMFSPKGYRNPMLRTFLMFTRQANQITQMITSDMPNIFRSDKEAKEKTKAFIRTVFCVSLNAVVMGWAARHFNDYDDQDDFLTDGLANILKNFPILGTAIANAIQRKQYSTGGFVDPISSFITATSKFIDNTIKHKEIDWDKLMKAVSEGMGPVGLPKVFSWRAWRAIREGEWWYLFTGGPKEDK